MNELLAMDRWLVEQCVAAADEHALRRLFDVGGEAADILSISGPVASIDILGPLRKGPSFWGLLGMGTSYAAIQTALEEAEGNETVERIELRFDSPGGTAAGVDAAAMAIRSATKPTTALIVGDAFSAAYWLASQADQILAMSPTSRVGSIGVVATWFDRSRREAAMGITRHVLVSNNSPKKVPDPSTPEGAGIITGQLDDVMDVFVRRVAEGRRTDTATVLSTFGQGDVVIAARAQQLGMIDATLSPLLPGPTSRPSVSKTPPARQELESRETSMEKLTLEELKAKHSDLVALIAAEVRDTTLKEERSRINRLVAWDKNEATHKIVVEAIKSGQSQEDVLAELTRAQQPTTAENMAAENAPELSTRGDSENGVSDNFLAEMNAAAAKGK